MRVFSLSYFDHKLLKNNGTNDANKNEQGLELCCGLAQS